MKSKLSIINVQIYATISFIIALFISLFLSYNEKNKIMNKPTLNSNTEYIISLYNRIFILTLSLIFLYISYYNRKHSLENKNLDIQLIASILAVIASLLTLIAVKNSKDDLINTENPAL